MVFKKINAFKNAYVNTLVDKSKKLLNKDILKADPKHAWIENLGVQELEQTFKSKFHDSS